MKRFLACAGFVLFLAACQKIDMTGLSGESRRTPHPQSNAGAAVTVWEFADLQCPACRSAHAGIVQPLLAKYGSGIRYEFKHFPLRSLHRYALDAAEAAECAADQGKFWEFIDLAFGKQEDLNFEVLPKWAAQLGLDVPLFERCWKSDIKRDVILADYEEGRTAGVAGTPTFFVNGTKVEAGLDTLGAAIDQAVGNLKQKL